MEYLESDDAASERNAPCESRYEQVSKFIVRKKRYVAVKIIFEAFRFITSPLSYPPTHHLYIGSYSRSAGLCWSRHIHHFFFCFYGETVSVVGPASSHWRIIASSWRMGSTHYEILWG